MIDTLHFAIVLFWGIAMFGGIALLRRRDRHKAKLWRLWNRPSAFGAYEMRYQIVPNWQAIFEVALGPLGEDENDWMTKFGVLHHYLTLYEKDPSAAEQMVAGLSSKEAVRKASDPFFSLLDYELGTITLKCWYDRETDLVRSYWVGHGELEDDSIARSVWPYGGGRDWVSERVGEVCDAWPEFRELVQGSTKESLIDWVSNVLGRPEAPGNRVYISPFGVGFVEQAEWGETANDRGLGSLPTHEITRLLRYLLDLRGYNTMKILSFPPEVDEQLQKCEAEYCGAGPFIDQEAQSTEPSDMSGYPALVESGISLGGFIKEHWFRTKGCSVGFSLKPLDLS